MTRKPESIRCSRTTRKSLRRIRLGIALAVAAVCLVGLPVGQAQNLAFEFNQDQYAPGETIDLEVTVVSGNFSIMCIASVHVGSPSGPAISGSSPFASPLNPFPISCPLPVVLGSCQSTTLTWNQLDFSFNQVPDGDYWLRIFYAPALLPAHGVFEEWRCVRIESNPASKPLLTSNGILAVGQTTTFDLAAPMTPASTYVVVASADQGPTNLAGEVFCFSQDLAFSLSFPNPNPSVFTNFQGMLDATGQASGIAVTVPNVAALQCLPLCLQAIVVATGGGTVDVLPSNGITMSID